MLPKNKMQLKSFKIPGTTLRALLLDTILFYDLLYKDGIDGE